MPAWELKVSFKIAGFDCSPSEITRCLQIEPDMTASKGDLIPRTSRRYQENIWAKRSPLSIEEPFTAQLAALLDLLPAELDALASVAGPWEAFFSCVVYSYESAPELFLDLSTIERLHRLGAGVDIDFYCLEPESEDA